MAVQWDNIRVTTGGPGKMVAYDDYDPWGMVLEGRSGNVGGAHARFEFLTKEHDTETGYDWLGVRGYDSRIGRFMTVDPHASSYPSLTPYHYAGNKPVAFIDPSGMDSVSAQGQNSSSASSTTLVIPPPASAAGASAAGELLLKILGKAGWLLFFATTFPGDAPPAAMQEENTAEADGAEEGKEKSVEKSIKSLQDRIAEHEQKLEDYKANPDAYDNKDFLKNAPSQEIRDRIIQGRIKHLENEINEFKKQLKNLQGGKTK
jgi:RHS repeat-associated protein